MHKDCAQLTYLDGLIYTVSYNNAAKTIIKTAKYDYAYTCLNDISKVMLQYFLKHHPNLKIDFVTSVPLSRYKFNLRGFNQSEVLAKDLSQKLKLCYLSCLNRVRNTKTQVGMHAEERLTNLKEAFSFEINHQQQIQNKVIIIVDDVYTTGTTLNEITKLLKANGANRVIGFTFAKSRT